jgi:hypothetical protein
LNQFLMIKISLENGMVRAGCWHVCDLEEGSSLALTHPTNKKLENYLKDCV